MIEVRRTGTRSRRSTPVVSGGRLYRGVPPRTSLVHEETDSPMNSMRGPTSAWLT